MKQKTKKRLIIFGSAILALGVVELVTLGYFGIGPLNIIRQKRMEKMPGNSAAYDFTQIDFFAGNPLEGKTVCFLGSSVTYGEASLQQSLPEYFAARTGCTVIKETVSGTTLVDNGSKSYIQRLRNNVDPNAHIDLLVCQLSTNDATKKLPLGEISKNTEYDTSTVTGAMEEIVSYAQNTWGCQVVFYTGSRYDSSEYAAMVLRLKELAEKWGIGVLNLWDSDSFNDISDSARKLYMFDKIHPTKAGYLKWWCPELESQLFSWLQAVNDAFD